MIGGMSRPRQFDRDAALDRAMEVFWEKGYESTSIRDLLNHMGIGRASLYDTFGNKHQVFTEALDSYIETVEARVLDPLRREGSPRRVLREFFGGLIESTGPAQPSCLIVKCATVTCHGDAETRRRVVAFLERVEAAFLAVVTRAREIGEIGTEISARAQSRLLLNGMLGLMVSNSAGRDGRVLRDVVRATLRSLG